MEKIAIYGAGGFGRELAWLIEEINASHHQYDFIGYFDDGKVKGQIVNSYPILGGIHEINTFDEDLSIVVAIGNPQMKRKAVEGIINKNISFPTLVHPSVIHGPKDILSIGKGCIICAGTILTVNVKIEDFVILNLSCTVGHDTVIGAFCSFMPTVNISGEVIIGQEVYVGTGAKIINQLEIGKRTIVGAGAVVAKSLPESCTAVGVPAKPIKFH